MDYLDIKIKIQITNCIGQFKVYCMLVMATSCKQTKRRYRYLDIYL